MPSIQECILSYLFTCLFFTSAYCQHVDNVKEQLAFVQKLSQHTYNNSHITHRFIQEQKKLLACFSSINHEAISAKEYKDTLMMLGKGSQFAFLTPKLPMLFLAIDKLYHIYGFKRLIKLVITNLKNIGGATGLLYEVEKGLQITCQKNNEKVLAFQQIFTIPGESRVREFDIVTNKRLIECKCINWKSSKIRTQIKDQKHITQIFRELYHIHQVYHVCSKNPVPKHWQAWFIQKKIAFSSDSTS